MPDDIIEVIFELILDGMAEAAGSKKVPMPIRITLGTILVLLVLALFGVILYIGINSGSVALIILSAVLLAAAIIWAVFKIKAFRSRRG